MKDTCILITNGCSNANVFQLLTDKKQRHINRTQGSSFNLTKGFKRLKQHVYVRRTGHFCHPRRKPNSWNWGRRTKWRPVDTRRHWSICRVPWPPYTARPCTSWNCQNIHLNKIQRSFKIVLYFFIPVLYFSLPYTCNSKTGALQVRLYLITRQDQA